MILNLYLVSLYHSFILCMLCSGEITSPCHQVHKIFCVIANDSNDHSCADYNLTESNPLAHYMNSSKYFKSYETYLFQRGYHHPFYDIIEFNISQVENLTLTGLDQEAESATGRAVIDCNGTSVAFKFAESSNIIIANITFTSCIHHHQHYLSRRHKLPETGFATLIFLHGMNLSLLGVTILNSVDEAFFIQDIVGNIIIDNVEVVHANTARKKIPHSGNTISYRYCDNRATSYVRIRDSRFISNTNFVKLIDPLDAGGLTFDIRCPNVQVSISNITALNNVGASGGNLAFLFRKYSNVSVKISDSQIEGGYAHESGGGMSAIFSDSPPVCGPNILNNSILHVYRTNFTSNAAIYYGGGVYMKQKQTDCVVENLITFVDVIFKRNLVIAAEFGGLAFHSNNFMVTGYLYHTSPQFQVTLINCSLYENYAKSVRSDGSAIGVIYTKADRYFKLSNTTIYNNSASGILGMNSNIILSQNITIVNNTGFSGGGLLLYQNAVIYLDAFTNVTIANNSAYHTGGGICIETDYLESQPVCFFQLGNAPLNDSSLIETINVSVIQNHANYAGNNIFGGSIDNCYMVTSTAHKSNKGLSIYNHVFKVPKNTKNPSSVSSPPHRVCPCQNNRIVCKPSNNFHFQVFPGETFQIGAVLVGQFDGGVPGTVQANLKSKQASLKQGENVQNLSSYHCDNLVYTVYTKHTFEELELSVQHIGDTSGFVESHQKYQILIPVKIKDCPVGFSKADGKISMCNCNHLLSNHKEHVSCDITTQTVKRLPPVWIGLVELDTGSKTVAYHGNCPLDYCVSTEVTLFATNNSLTQDQQCAFGRAGVLCGSCPDGLSIVLGTSECKACSNYWLLLLIPFALLGISLLVMLILFDITIADGTLSGVIFYFNIVGSISSVIFAEQSIKYLTPSLKLIVSLINLELGISLCLFDGMDSYVKAWLDFALPFYLWLLAGVFIYLGGRCKWIVRKNAVKVLATLVLLSYTRLVSAVAGALQLSVVQLENGKSEERWLLDGNIKYFKGKHLPLALFAVMAGLLLISFSLCLFFIQWLQKVSDNKAFFWVNRFKPFFDAYTGPFTSRGRFWTGLLLLSRVALLIVSTINTSGDPKIALGTTTMVVTLLLLTVIVLPNSLYKRRCLNILECSSLVNLGFLASLLIIFPSSVIVSHICIVLELVTFTYVIISQFLKVRMIRNSCCYRRMLQHGNKFIGMISTTAYHQPAGNDVDIFDADFPPFVNFNEDREPLLAPVNNCRSE